MATPLATIDCEAFLADFEARGFGLTRVYENLLAAVARDGAVRLGERAPPAGRLEIADGGIPAALNGDLYLWADVAPHVAAFSGFRRDLQAAKRRDAGFPDAVAAWDGTKREAAYHYRQIAEDLGLPQPTGSERTRLVFALPTAGGTLRLSLDMGGRADLIGRLPIEYAFKPPSRPSICLSDLRWLHAAFTYYFVFGVARMREDGAGWVEFDERSAVHGIRVSLMALKCLVTHIV